jgi:hypothetical protein
MNFCIQWILPPVGLILVFLADFNFFCPRICFVISFLAHNISLVPVLAFLIRTMLFVSRSGIHSRSLGTRTRLVSCAGALGLLLARSHESIAGPSWTFFIGLGPHSLFRSCYAARDSLLL